MDLHLLPETHVPCHLSMMKTHGLEQKHEDDSLQSYCNIMISRQLRFHSEITLDVLCQRTSEQGGGRGTNPFILIAQQRNETLLVS